MFDKPQDDVTIPFPSVSEPTEDALEQFAPIYAEDYAGFKQDFINWLLRKGKNPFKENGYADETARTTHYKIEQIYRWKWESEDEFTKDVTPDDAELFIDKLVKETTLQDREVRDYIKAFKRLFTWFNETKGTEHNWSYSNLGELEQQGASKRQHYYRGYEMAALYDAAIEMGSMKNYHAISPEERDRLKIHLAQRLGKAKNQIGPDDFERANSWKFPSLIAMSIDLGLRPIEVSRAKRTWLRLEDSEVVIPPKDASKGEEPWDCVLSSRSVRALSKWLQERQSYEKYDDTHKLWLTKYGNPYGSDSLNDLLNRLMEKTDIKPQGRDLTWYSIRRGSATMWAENGGIAKAREQVRHMKLETTKRYLKSETSKRQTIAEDNW